MDNVSSKEKRLERLKFISPLLPIIIFSALVPLLIYTRYIPLSEFISSRWMGLPISPDIFSFYKMLVIIGCAAAALILLVLGIIRKRLKPRMPVVIGALAAYAVLIILSSVLSDYSSIAFWGAPERYEGAVTLISYLIMFIYTIAVVDNIRKVRLVLYPIIASSALIVIIGGLQFFGVDIFKINFFRSLLNLNPTASQPYGVQTIHKIYTSYSTLYNPNMLSHYLAMVLPLGFAFFAARKGNAGRIGAALLIYLLMLSLFGASSSGGYYALAASVVLLLFLAFPYIRKNIMNLVMLTVIVVGLLMVTNLFTGGRIASRIGVLSVSNEISMLEREGEKIFINDISLADDEVFIDTTDKDFYVRNSEEIISVRDRDGNTIPVVLFEGGVREGFKGDVIAFESPEYRQYVITTNEDYSIFAVKAGIRVMYFHMTDNGVMVPGLGNKLDVIRPVERIQFLYERPYLFSKRGYIWSGVLPLLKDTVVIGRGPDTTFLTYPQYDYIGKINMAGYFHIVIEKPHCYYLQLAHDTGWISLAILLALFAFYFFSTIRLLAKSKKGGLWRAFTIASLCSVCGYLIAGVIYDSSVQTAPVFWTILAIGFALNQIGKRELSQAKTESRDSG